MLLLLKRRGVSFVPTDLGGDLKLWLPADQITGLNDADPVATWVDRSGSGNDFTAAGAARPTFQTNELNGLPGVLFDGVANMMTSAAAVMTTLDNWSIAAVVRPSVTTIGKVPVMNGSSNGYGISTSTDTGKKGWIAGNVAFNSSTENADTDAKVYVLSRASGGGATLHVNGVALTVADSVPLTPTASRVGGHTGTDFWNGFAFDVLMTTPKLSDANRDKLETYLGTKWGITVV